MISKISYDDFTAKTKESASDAVSEEDFEDEDDNDIGDEEEEEEEETSDFIEITDDDNVAGGSVREI